MWRMYSFCHRNLWKSGICRTFNPFFLILLPSADATTWTCFWFNCDPQDKGFTRLCLDCVVPVSALMNCFRDDRRHCRKTCQSLFLQSCHNFDLIWMRPEQARTAKACTGPEGKVKPPQEETFLIWYLCRRSKDCRLHMVLLFHLHQIDLICKVAKEKFVETPAPELWRSHEPPSED